jgi:heme oxygenase (mycobilin-producing)
VSQVIKINAITVPEGSGDELARRFAARAGAVDDQEGFEGFELLRPTDDRLTWLVVTRWRDEESFQAWVSSRAFGEGHAKAGQSPSGSQSGEQSPSGSQSGEQSPSGSQSGEQGDRPVAASSELWSYVVEQTTRG